MPPRLTDIEASALLEAIGFYLERPPQPLPEPVELALKRARFKLKTMRAKDCAPR